MLPLATLKGEDHARARRLHNVVFSPRAVARYAEKIIVPVARAVVNSLAGRTQADLLVDFAAEMPIRVVNALFGLSRERLRETDGLVRAMIRAIMAPGNAAAVAQGERAHAAIASELREIAARELVEPSDTLLGEIAMALKAGGAGTVEACER